MNERLNANFDERVVIRPEDHQWQTSPMPGVDRMMLDRIGGEVARATSIVRYAPNSEFSSHTHGGGEEFFVLEGVFEDEHGQYPHGTYVRNPIGSAHTPKIGPSGALIFVKLHQFDDEDTQAVVKNTEQGQWMPGLVDGLSVMSLHEHRGEHVALVRWAPNTQFNPHTHVGGEEILVLDGTFHDEHGSYPKGSWIRSPHMSRHRPFTKVDGAPDLCEDGPFVNPQGDTMSNPIPGLALYHFQSCPFCRRARAAIDQMGLTLEERDIHQNPDFRSELIAGGGKGQVPCLRIENEDGSVRWLYESIDIVNYVREHHAA